MYGQFKGQNLFKVRLVSDILPGVATDEAEYYFDISEPVSIEQFFVTIEFQKESNREIIEIHRTSLGGTRLHYYQYNREDCNKTHEVDVFVQINAIAQYFNIAMDNIDTLGWTRKMKNPGNKVRVYGGIAEDLDNQIINVGDATLTLNEGNNYVYYDYLSNGFAFSDTLPTEFDVMSLVTVAGGNITDIQDLRAFKLRLKNGTILSKFSESGGFPYYNSNKIAYDSDLLSGLNGKVDKIIGKGLSTEDFTTAEKIKLAIVSEHYRGTYLTLEALQIAIPTGNQGDFAIVDGGEGVVALQYIRDSNEGWVLSASEGAVSSVNGLSGVVVLTTGNIPDTTDKRYVTELEKAKLATNHVPETRTITINGVSYNLSADRSWTITASGGFRRSIESTATRTGNNTFTITDVGNAGQYNLILQRCTVVKRKESGTVKQAMVHSSVYANDLVTVTIIGDIMSSIDSDSLKYASEKAKHMPIFAISGPIGGIATNVSYTNEIDSPIKIFGADVWAGTAGNGTTTFDINKNGTTMFTTKPSITGTNKSSNGISADDGTTANVGDFITIDIDAYAATPIQDGYVKVFYAPLYNYYLA